ncbi:MAG TPA: 2-isopropylmalate synthase [Myxococcales bacterium]|jgi:2-isopropylmalate synthase|nr:2-isopropylmalate synthase [Myxococcales bacterium]
MSQTDRVLVFDTTLRDGEQAPGASMNLAQKLQVARALATLGVDIMEVGFPVASPGDFAAVQAVAQKVEGPVICALARANRPDIDAALQALQPAPRRRVHVFLATSPIHRQHKLRMSTADVVRVSSGAIEYARERCEDIEFSAEDAARTEPDFLVEVVERAIEAGATTINIPDTVGYAVPAQFGGLIEHLRANVRGIEKVVLSVHCHDDLGLAVANSLSALQAGARQVECTINGIGERAGNCSLEEVVMAIRTRSDYLRLHTAVRTQNLCAASRTVAAATGFHVARNKAVVGQNAFAHESGIHQHGMLQNADTYEVMRPEDVGFGSTNLVLGKHSGRHALASRLRELGHDLTPDQVDRAFEELKKLADRKKEIYDGDLDALLVNLFQNGAGAGRWQLVSLNAVSGTGTLPSAAVSLLRRDGRKLDEAATGDGPVDAVFKCIERITGVKARLREFQISSVTAGEDAQGQVMVVVEHEGRTYRGRGLNTDIVMASAEAYLEVVNRIAAGRLPRTAPAAPEVICGAV